MLNFSMDIPPQEVRGSRSGENGGNFFPLIQEIHYNIGGLTHLAETTSERFFTAGGKTLSIISRYLSPVLVTL